MTPLTRTLAVLALIVAGAVPALAQTSVTPQTPAVPQAPPAPPVDDHASHQALVPPAPSGQGHEGHAPQPVALPPFIPTLTDDDRRAAFPDVHGHPSHDNAVNSFVLFDQLEWQAGRAVTGASLDAVGWLGTDLHRLWFRAEADRPEGRFEQAQVQLYYGRAFSRWWTALAGVRQDVRAGELRTAAALGLQGLAPFWIEVEASLYVEPNGRSHVRVEAEHDVLVTNRLVLQPLVEFEVYTKGDRALDLGRGLSTADVGLRLRYEVRRELAPYVGLAWHRGFFGTAELVRASGRPPGRLQVTTGVRAWF